MNILMIIETLTYVMDAFNLFLQYHVIVKQIILLIQLFHSKR